jgi:hypothetical protein
MSYVDFFAGARPAHPDGSYVIQILEGNDARFAGNAPCSSYRYVRANLVPQAPYVPLVKGKEYVLKITHSAGDSINYYYDETNPYAYGAMWAGGQYQSGYDLCARIEGANHAISGEDFACTGELYPFSHYPNGLQDLLASYMAGAGIRWNREVLVWQWVQPDSAAFNWGDFDSVMLYSVQRRIKVLPILEWTPSWACTRWNHLTSVPEESTPSIACPPRNLYNDVDTNGVVNPRNFWARFVFEAVRRYKPGGTFWQEYQIPALGDTYGATWWEIWNEANDLTNYWQTPGAGHGYAVPLTLADSIEYQAALYARLCDVACQAAHHDDSADRSAKLLVGAVGGVHLANPDDGTGATNRLVRGKEWLHLYYAKREENGAAGVAVHPYQYPKDDLVDNSHALNPDTFARDLDTVRTIMKANGDGDKELWATELSWGPDTTSAGGLRAALSIPAAYVFAAGGSPVNFYNRIFWYSLHNPWDGGGSLLKLVYPDPSNWTLTAKPCYHAYSQMVSELVGHRLNGRVSSGDSAKDTCGFVYEFEDTLSHRRRWVGWRTWHPPEQNPLPVPVRIPARTDTLWAWPLNRGALDSIGSRVIAATDGWLQVALDTAPVYIHEAGDTLRPDLVVDSIWTIPDAPAVGMPVCFCARVKNIGTDSSPSGIPSDPSQLPVMFYVNDSVVSSFSWLPSIQKDDSADIWGEANWSPARPGSYLVKVKVNGGKDFMELNWDNNANYRGYRVTHPQHAEMGINPGHNEPVAVTNVPEVILSSFVSDSSFGTACSMRVAQEYWAASETLPASEDFGWMGYRPSLMWHLNHGAGKYRLEVRFMILGDSGSGYRDTSVILDDSCQLDLTAPPSGSVAIRCTTRFYAARVCTLIVAGSDDSTGAGLGAMRFSTQPFKNLLQNSDLLLDASGWEGNHFVYHESLGGMVELPQIRDSLVYFGQMIPPESLEPWFGCPARLALVLIPATRSTPESGGLAANHLSSPPTKWSKGARGEHLPHARRSALIPVGECYPPGWSSVCVFR